MPVKHRTLRRRKTFAVADLDVNDLTDLTCGWGPGSRGSRWQTEEEYLDTYEELRDELLAHEAAGGFATPFAEELWQERRDNR